MSEFEIFVITRNPKQPKRKPFKYVPIEQFITEETKGRKRENKPEKEGVRV